MLFCALPIKIASSKRTTNVFMKESNLVPVIKITAGDEVDSNCLKCKGLTNHTIIALVEDKIAKVQCNVCGARHNYRPAKAEKNVKMTSVTRKDGKIVSNRTVATPKKTKKEAGYEKLLAGRNLAEAIPYTMTTTFKQNDLVDHPIYGIGIVTATIQPDKIELTLKEGVKKFICKLDRITLK